MSIEIITRIFCDGSECNEEIRSETEHRSTWANQTVWNAKSLAENAGWLTVNRGRYHTQAHYCPKCADSGSAVPIPRKAKPRHVVPDSWLRKRP